jgi:hypothetical protein
VHNVGVVLAAGYRQGPVQAAFSAANASSNESTVIPHSRKNGVELPAWLWINRLARAVTRPFASSPGRAGVEKVYEPRIAQHTGILPACQGARR